MGLDFLKDEEPEVEATSEEGVPETNTGDAVVNEVVAFETHPEEEPPPEA